MSIINPVHILPHQIAFICNILDNFNENYVVLLTPKADGTTHYFKDKYHDYIAENVDSFMYVFDCMTYPSVHNNTLLTRFRWYRTRFKNQYLNNLENLSSEENQQDVASSLDDVIKLLKDDDDLINLIKSKKIAKWFPKIHILLKLSSKDFLKLIDEPPKTSYPNDGWIVTVFNNNHQLFGCSLKIKPKDQMTIDLFYNPRSKQFSFGNKSFVDVFMMEDSYEEQIYRCKFDEDLDMFVPLKPRLDKAQPNNDNIIEFITSYHTNSHFNRWKPSDVTKYLNDKDLYYPLIKHDNKMDVYLKKYLDLRRLFVNKLVKNLTKPTDLILDIGCGNGSVLKQNIKYKKYIGIDKDYGCLVRCENNIKKGSDLLLWGDIIEEKWGYFDDILYKYSYDLILMMNIVHLFDEKYDNLINNLNKITKSGTKLLILTLDESKLIDINYKNQLIIKHNSNNLYDFTYKWINKEFTEKIINSDTVKKILEDNGWNLMEEQNHDSDKFYGNVFDEIILRIYDSFHTIMTFIKK
jgi:SAM-dependent methyltransferase